MTDSHSTYLRTFAAMQVRYKRAPIHLLPSEIDLFSELDWLGLPQFGQGFIRNPDAALRRKNVAAELEDDLWPGLGTEIDVEEDDSNSYNVDVDMQEFISWELESADSQESVSLLFRAEYFERKLGIII